MHALPMLVGSQGTLICSWPLVNGVTTVLFESVPTYLTLIDIGIDSNP